MDDLIKVRTLTRIDDPKGGASIQANVTVKLPRSVAEKLIKQRKAEKVDKKK